MVFFVIAGVFGLAEGILPSTMARGGTAAGGVPLPVSPIIVELNATTGQACELRVRPSQLGALRSPAELVAELQRIMNLPGFGPDTPVVLRSQDSVMWNDVAAAWTAWGEGIVLLAEPTTDDDLGLKVGLVLPSAEGTRAFVSPTPFAWRAHDELVVSAPAADGVAYVAARSTELPVPFLGTPEESQVRIGVVRFGCGMPAVADEILNP